MERCEITVVVDTGIGPMDLPCENEAFGETLDGIKICKACFKRMEDEGLLPGDSEVT